MDEQAKINGKMPEVNVVLAFVWPNSCLLQVSDGIETSEPLVLRVAAFELQLVLLNNSGLQLGHGGWALLHAANLSYATNAAPQQDLEIRFDVTEPPRHGLLQRLRGNNRWQTVQQFSQKLLEKEKIRYVHTDGSPPLDEFRFKVIAGEHEFATEYTFRVTFSDVAVELVRNEELLVDRVQESFITDDFLQAATRPHPSSDADIVYVVLSEPLFGALLLSPADLTHRHASLGVGDTFTQDDVGRSRLKYRLHKKTYSPIKDAFKFQVRCQGKETQPYSFSIKHTPSSGDAVITVDKLEVKEGGRIGITKNHLNIQIADIGNVLYNITSHPLHGTIDLVDEGDIASNRVNTTFFTSEELAKDLIFYQHDNSETLKDRIHFVAVAEDPTKDFQYVGTLHIHILAVNDNHPFRVLEKVLNVVTDSERVVTSSDLQYSDDFGTKPDQILYTRRKVPNGEFYHVEDSSEPVYKFSQEDIDQRRIIFRHKGPSYSKAVISVSDGELSSTGILEIVASQPFIEIVNNSGLVVARGQSAVISNHNLSVETNMNAWGPAITFAVTSSPR